MPEPELEGIYKDIADVQQQKQDDLLDQWNVQGIAVGHKITKNVDTQEPCLTILVSQKLPEEMLGPDDKIKSKIGDFKTDVVESGLIFAGAGATSTRTRRRIRPRQPETPNEPSVTERREGGATTWMRAPVEREAEEFASADIELLRDRVRPVKGGYSVGHHRVTAGTIATAVYDAAAFPGTPNKYYILSNNHVLANSNSARVGDPILQPGPADGGTYMHDTIAQLTRFVPINFQAPYGNGNTNLVDAAIAEGEFRDLDREVYWIGQARAYGS